MRGGCSHITERGLARGNEKPVKDLSQRPESSGTCFKETTLALMGHMFSGPFQEPHCSPIQTEAEDVYSFTSPPKVPPRTAGCSKWNSSLSICILIGIKVLAKRMKFSWQNFRQQPMQGKGFGCWRRERQEQSQTLEIIPHSLFFFFFPPKHTVLLRGFSYAKFSNSFVQLDPQK